MAGRGAEARSAARPAAGPWADGGQALVLGALALGILLAPLCLGVVAASAALAARAALGRAVAAAALAAAATERVAAVRVRVAFIEYACRPAPGAPACQGRPGAHVVSLAPGGAGGGPSGLFGPLPGWAAAAGCVGTVWPGTAPPGDHRICTGQSLVGAVLAPPEPAALASAAARYLDLNLAGDRDLSGGRLVAVVPGPDGAVTVVAAARTRLPGPFGRVRASAEAWPSPG